MALDEINISKIERMILVKDTVDRLQRATLDDVLASFCAKTGLSQNTKNLKQYIRRDLESLCVDANYLDKDYFLPNKDKLEPGEEKDHKNVRVEYFIIKESCEILGAGILEQANGKIITPGRDYIEWKLTNLSNSFDSEALSFSMKLSQAGFISISIKKDELPFKLIIGKNSSKKSPTLQEISATFGHRTSMLLLNEGGLEESISNSKFGHA